MTVRGFRPLVARITRELGIFSRCELFLFLPLLVRLNRRACPAEQTGGG